MKSRTAPSGDAAPLAVPLGHAKMFAFQKPMEKEFPARRAPAACFPKRLGDAHADLGETLAPSSGRLRL